MNPTHRTTPVPQAKLQTSSARPAYPFAAIVGQDEMKLALLLNVIAPSIGGVLIMGERGTGKSTAVRALASLLPPIYRVRGCLYSCDPADEKNLCDDCGAQLATTGGPLTRERAAVPVVDLPLGATEDRVCGTINLERALTHGRKTFEPGLLARANRGFLYIDEVNLLEDHLVDLLLDAAATGRHQVERDGLSLAHPSRFVLVGSGNPEEGELRPQLLDRFGLYTEIHTINDLEQRIEIIERRESFERDPTGFQKRFARDQTALRRRLARAQKSAGTVEVPRALMRLIAELCLRLKIDGHRGELTLTRAARALAAWAGRGRATHEDVQRVAAMSLQHRLRRDPLEQTSGGSRLQAAIDELFGAGDAGNNHVQETETHARHSTRTSQSAASNIKEERPVESTKFSNATPEAKSEPATGGGRQNGPGTERPPAQDKIIASMETYLPELRLDQQAPAGKTRAAPTSVGRRDAGARRSIEARRGRGVGVTSRPRYATKVDVAATWRVAAPLQGQRRQANPAPRKFQLAASDLRFKQFRRRVGTLFILAIDTSGSMALNRINQAKGALAQLLRRSYVNRDHVALISFRDREASLLLRPSASPALAKRILDALPVGGATPLAAGLVRSLEVAQRAARQGTQRIVLLVFTDGRANVPLIPPAGNVERPRLREQVKVEIQELGAALRRGNVLSVIVDTQNRYTSGGEGEFLAGALGGQYLHLPLARATAGSG